jgi:copper(I)-binding protein
MDNGVMRMRPLPVLDLPARQTVTLAPGHYHIMLLGLTQQLKTGDSVPLKLHTQDAQGKETVLEVTAAVKGAG